jgi:hypothetical protein
MGLVLLSNYRLKVSCPASTMLRRKSSARGEPYRADKLAEITPLH